MNKCYTKVWNAALGQVVVASELASGDTIGGSSAGRSPRSAPFFAVNALALALAAVGASFFAAPSAIAASAMCVDPVTGQPIATQTISGVSPVACGEGAKALSSGSIAIGASATAGRADDFSDANRLKINEQSVISKMGVNFTDAAALQSYVNAVAAKKVSDPAKVTAAEEFVYRAVVGHANNIAMGVGAAAEGSRVVSIGENAGGVTTAVNADGSQVRGMSPNWNLQNVNIGTNAGTNRESNMTVSIGHQAGYIQPGNAALAAQTTVPWAAREASTYVGNRAGMNTASYGNIGIGEDAGAYITDTANNGGVFVGQGAGSSSKSGVASYVYDTLFTGSKVGITADGKVANPQGPLVAGANTAIGPQAFRGSTGSGNTAIGRYALANGAVGGANTAVGEDALLAAKGDVSTAIGAGAGRQAESSSAVSIGRAAQGQGNSSIAIGADAQAAKRAEAATVVNGIAIGTNTRASASNAIAIGKRANTGTSTTAESAIAMGSNATATGKGSIALGGSTDVTTKASGWGLGMDEDVTIPAGTKNPTASADYAIALGTAVTASGLKSIAVGFGNTVSGSTSIAVGTNNTVTGNNSGVFGDPTIINADNSYSVGNNNTIAAGETDVFVLGNNVTQTASYGVNLGSNSAVLAEYGVAIGAGSVANRLGKNGNAANTGYVPTGANVVDTAFIKATDSTTLGAVSVGTGAIGGNRQIINVAAGTNDSDAVNVSQLKAVASAAAAGDVHYYSVNDGKVQQANYNNDGAKTVNSLAAGTNATAGMIDSKYVGASASAGGNAVAVGNNSQASAAGAIAIGDGAKVYQGYGDTFGATGLRDITNYGIAMGNGATAIGNNLVIGNAAAGTLLAAGQDSGTLNINNVSVGNGAGAKLIGREVVAIGYQAGTSASGGNNIIIGKNAGANLGTTTNANGYIPTPSPSVSGGVAGSSSNIVIGDGAGSNMSASTGSNTFIGQNAGVNASSNIASFVAGKGYVDASGNVVNPAAAFANGNSVGIGGLAGSNTSGEMNAAVGWKSGTFITGSGNSSFGILAGYKATGHNNLMMGSSFSGAYTVGSQNVALGNGTGGNVTGSNNSAVGNAAGAVVSGNNNVAVGNAAGQNVTGLAATPAAGNNNTAIGNQSGSNVSGSGNFAGGNGSGRFITGTENTSLGRGANVGTAAAPLLINRTVALGSASTTYSDDSIAIGTKAIAGTTTGNVNAIAIGNGAQATGLQSISVGTGNVVTGSYSGAFGDPTTVSGSRSYSFGNNNTIAQDNTFVLGNSVTTTQGNSVVLGNLSTDRAATTETTGTVNGITYGTFAGPGSVANGVVSVGAVGAERQIINVAAGKISADSTDAINGSQLYMTNAALGTLAQTVGPQAVTNINTGTAPIYNTVNVDGSTYATSNNIEGSITNLNNYVNQGWVAQGNGADVNTVTPGSKVNFVNGQNTTAVVTDAGNGVTNVTFNALSAQGNVNNAQLPVVYTLADGTKVYIQNDGSFNTVADGSGTTVNAADVIASMNNATNSTTGPMVLNNVGAGDLSSTSTQAVNGSQINSLGTSIANNLGGGSTFDPTTGTVTAPTYTVINGNPSTGTTINATNVGDALSAINTAVQQPITFAGDTGTDVTRQLGSTLNIKGGATTPLTTGNIGVVANGTDQLDIQLAKNLTGLESIQVGGTSITTNGVVINNGPSITTTGINAGNTVITNVAAGAVNATSTDAVNGSQLYQTNVNVTNAQNTANTALDTANKGINFGDGTTANNYKLGETINVKGDSNVTSTTTADGVQLALAKDLTVDSVDAGGTIVNNLGVTTIGGNVYGDKNFTLALGTTVNMGGNVITNVAAGTNATDAVNVSQLNQTVAAAKSEVKAGTNVASVTTETNADGSTVYTVNADGAKVSAGSTAVTVTAGAKDANNVTDYIVDVSQATKDSLANADSAMQNVVTQIDGVTVKTLTKNDNTANFVSGDNVVLSSDGAGGIKVSTAKNVTFDSVNAGGTVINNNGVTTSNGNVYGNSLTLQAGTTVNMGGNVITNVGAGVNDTDAVNMSQLNEVKQAANAGWNVTTGATGSGIANGTSVTNVGPGGTHTITAGDNIVTTQDGANITVAVNPDLKVNSVQTGNTTMNDSGVVISGGPSMTNTGIDAGDQKITNVADGEISATSKDAVNGSQLHQTNTIVNNLGNSTATGLGGGSTYDASTGNLTTVLNVGGNTYNNVNDALNAVSNVAAGSWNLTAQGQNQSNVGNQDSVDLRNSDGNIVVSKTADSNDVTFDLAKNISVDSVKAGNTTINNDGLTIANGPTVTTAGINAGGKVITNVAAGVADTDAVNVSQLKGVLTTANSYTDARVAQVQQDVWNLGGRVDELEDNMHAGVATAMALKQAPYVPGKTTYFAGAAAYKSQGAVGISLRRTADNGRWSLEGGFSSNKDGTGVFVGVSGVLGDD